MDHTETLLIRHVRSCETMKEPYRTMLEVTEAISAHRDLKTLFKELAQRLPFVIQFDYIGLILHDPEKNVMRSHILRTAEDEGIPPGIEIPMDESAGGWVLRAQQPLVVSRLDDELRFPKVNAVLRQIGVESYCMLPITTAVRRLGAMGFGSLGLRT